MGVPLIVRQFRPFMAFIVETVSGKKNGKTTSDPKSNGIKRPVFKPFFKSGEKI